MNRPREKQGTSLLELILVMGILALLAAIAVPRLSGFSAGRTYIGEWNRLTALLRYARSEAISRATQIEIHFHTDRRSYGIVADAAEANRDTDPTGKPKPLFASMSEHVLPKKLAFDFPDDPSSAVGRNKNSTSAPAPRTDGIVSVLFLPDGSVDDASPKVLRLVEENGKFCRALQQDPSKRYTPLKEGRP